MIYTLTLNPSLDYTVGVDKLTSGKINNSRYELIFPGGRGLNISGVLQVFGIPSIALGFIAGFIGNEIKRRFKEAQCVSDFVKLKKGDSRINIKIKTRKITEINTNGPIIDKESLRNLADKINELQSGDILVLAESLPEYIADSFYAEIMNMLSDRDILFVVDAEGELLLRTLPYKPFLIKPDSEELGKIFGTALKTREEVIPYAQRLMEMGARNVLVSLADRSAVLVTENGDILTSAPPKIKVRNPIGSGNAIIAGFLADWVENEDYGSAFKRGMEAGGSSMLSEYFETREEMNRMCDISD